MTSLSIIPLATEKAYRLVTSKNEYMFRVPLTANKQEIAKSVEAQFDVSVVSVRTAIQSGKSVRFSRGKGKYPGTTTRHDSKKAFVTLKEGDSIQVFAEADKPAEEKK